MFAPLHAEPRSGLEDWLEVEQPAQAKLKRGILVNTMSRAGRKTRGRFSGAWYSLKNTMVMWYKCSSLIGLDYCEV